MAGLEFRGATEADTRRIAEIIHGAPGREATALCGGEERARRFGFALTAYQGRTSGWGRTVLAVRDGNAVGVLQWRIGREDTLSIGLGLAWLAIGALGVGGAARTAYRDRARRRVNPGVPPESFHIEELHVDVRHRGSGIGGQLLAHSEGIAHSKGCRSQSLITHVANSAQRLYRRSGFEVVARREDAEYERITGISGRMLMVKALGAPAVDRAR